MFESLFQYPTVVARHRQGPAADERERFLLHRAKEGATRGTLLQIARELLVIVKYISVTTDKAIGRHDLEVAADRWARRQQRKHRSHGPRWSRELFLHVGTHWLRFLGRWQKPEPAPPLSFAARIQDFVSYMREERGLSEVTSAVDCSQTVYGYAVPHGTTHPQVVLPAMGDVAISTTFSTQHVGFPSR